MLGEALKRWKRLPDGSVAHLPSGGLPSLVTVPSSRDSADRAVPAISPPPPSQGQVADAGAQEQLPNTRESERKRPVVEQLMPQVLRKAARWYEAARPQPRFVALQQWEGHVVEVRDDSFVARLIDLEHDDGGEEEAEIFIAEVDEDDLELLRPDAVFYWSIGYRDQGTGRERVSSIRFRRLPGVTERDIERALGEADETIDRLGWK